MSIVRGERPPQKSYGSTYKEDHYYKKHSICVSEKGDDDVCPYYGGSADPLCPEVPEDDSNVPVVTGATLTRFWILFVFSVMSWVHSFLWNTWGPINESVEAAFGWSSSTVAMTVNWTTIMFMLFVVPMCMATQRCGMRSAMIFSSAILLVGTSVRCLTTVLPWFTILCQLCSVLTGIASTLILAAPSLIASSWFPPNERTTAVAVMMGASQLGGIGSYLEPLLVKQPGPGVLVEDIRDDIMHLLYTDVAVTGALFLAVVIYFPSKPSIPPSVSSSTDRLDIYSGVILLARDKNFLMFLLAYGASIGPPIAWLAVLNYSLQPLGYHQEDAMWVGLSSVLVSSFFPIVYGRVMDHFQGHMRSSLVALMVLSSVCFYWFLLISYGMIAVSTWQVYASVVGGLTFNYTTIPLFYEMAVEMAYPVPEILVSGILTAADNLTSTLFLLVFLIPNIGYQWVTSVLVLCGALSIVPFMAAKINFTRAECDSSDT